MAEEKKKYNPAVLIPWEKKKEEYKEIKGDEQTVKKLWEEFDKQAALFLWFMVEDM
jgi:hypothetical protein